MPRALTIALGKDLFFCLFLEFLCRGLWSRPSAKTREILKYFFVSLFLSRQKTYLYIYHHTGSTKSTTNTYISRTLYIYITNIMYVHLVVHKFIKSNQSSKPPTRAHRRAARTHHPPQPSCICVEGGVSKAPGSGDVRGGLLEPAVD